MVTSTGKEIAGVCSAVFVSRSSTSSESLSSVLSESLLPLDSALTVAAMVGRTTCSTNSRRLGVKVMSSGVEATTNETEKIPLFTGGSSAVAGCGDSGVPGVTFTCGAPGTPNGVEGVGRRWMEEGEGGML